MALKTILVTLFLLSSIAHAESIIYFGDSTSSCEGCAPDLLRDMGHTVRDHTQGGMTVLKDPIPLYISNINAQVAVVDYGTNGSAAHGTILWPDFKQKYSISLSILGTKGFGLVIIVPPVYQNTVADMAVQMTAVRAHILGLCAYLQSSTKTTCLDAENWYDPSLTTDGIHYLPALSQLKAYAVSTAANDIEAAL